MHGAHDPVFLRGNLEERGQLGEPQYSILALSPGPSILARIDSNENVVVIQSLSLSLFPLFPPPICHEVMGPDATILVF